MDIFPVLQKLTHMHVNEYECECEYFSLHVSGHRGMPKTSYHFLILSHGSLRTTPFVLINLSLYCFFLLNYQHLLKNHKIWATPHINGPLNCFWNGGLPLLDHHLWCIFCRKSSQKMSKYVHQSWIGRNMMQRIYLQNNIFQGSIQLWSLYLANIWNIFAGIGRQLITEKK